MPTFQQSQSLSLLAYEPLWVGTNLISDQLGIESSALSVKKTAFGGYWQLNFRLTDRQTRIEDWIENGLGRHIELYNPALELIWEGFVNKVSGNIGSLSIARGPHLNIGNRIQCVYSTVDTTTDPPTMGIRAATAVANDADSQARYGIIERVISVGGTTAVNAEQIRDTALDELKDPETSETDNLTSTVGASVAVECLGYFHWLKTYTYTAAGVGTLDADAKIQAILGADPNGIFSTDYNDIVANATPVRVSEQRQRTAMALIKGIVGLGDASFDRYLFGIYAERKARYEVMPTDITYQRSLSDPEQKLSDYNSGSRVLPWDSQPAKWVFYTDLLIGKTQQTERRLDPRFLFIEQSTFTVPWGLTMQGSRTGKLSQLLARLGLGGAT